MPSIQEVPADTEGPSVSTGVVSAAPSHIEEIRPNKYSSLSTLSEQLDEKNWATWSKRMISILRVCRVYDYVKGTVKKPIASVDSTGASNWASNDEYAKHLLLSNITSSQLNHIDQDKSAAQVWKELVSLHQATGMRTVLTYMRTLYHMTAADDENIPDHINNMRAIVEQINTMRIHYFKINDYTYAGVLAQSLPAAWDPFIDNMFRFDVTGDEDSIPPLSIVQFERALKDEYYRRVGRNDDKALLGSSEHSALAVSKKNSLANRISTQRQPSTMYCNNCKKSNHPTDQCRHLGKPRCTTCGKFGHMTADCWRDDKKKRGPPDASKSGYSNQKDSRVSKKRFKNTNLAEEEVSAMCIEDLENDSTVNDPVSISDNDNDNLLNVGNPSTVEEAAVVEDENYDFYEPSDAEESVHYFADGDNDMTRPMYVDCLADTGTTSHVFNQRDLFTDYRPINDTYVGGVGGTRTRARGRGTVRVTAEINQRQRIIKFRDALHVPECKHNLISLGRWEDSGRSYQAQNGLLKLFAPTGDPIIQGERTRNNLYWLRFQKPVSIPSSPDEYAFTAAKESWDTWHRRYGHIGYSGLQALRDKNLVHGFLPDPRSAKSDCVPCTQAKLAHTPFPSTATHTSAVGKVTHIDLWGKYAVHSIHGNQYYILFVDDYSRYVTVNFLKSKTQATQNVRDYLTHLIARDIAPLAIRVDRGTEFVNEDLRTWCTQRGIDIQMTAPYSPSQNGVAERMNRTLVELARAMLTARQLPEFLWEPAVAHAAYLRNRSFSRAVPDATPYERRHGAKPDVSHFREFGSQVWILTEGPNVPRKMLPKSIERTFMGFDDGARAVKYYSKDTRKVLTSWNYHFINPDNTPSNLPDHDLSHDSSREGEPSGNIPDNVPSPSTQGTTSSRSKKRSADEEGDTIPRKTRGVCLDFKRLNDPFSDTEEEDEDTMVAVQLMIHDESYNAATSDSPISLADAKNSPDWPKWEEAIRVELEVLRGMRTWVLVDKPPDAVPIANKWVFVTKTNNTGEIVKYKARLVAKGCSQRPGFDYNETYSPVVRIETIRAILALVPQMDLRVQQMDIKGAYLNGTLKENVYMRQPEGYSDGTNRICHLKKTIYGLKQSGREWNNNLNEGLQSLGFTQLLSDSCAYIRRHGKDFEILTAWVDDLLLFTTSEEGMRALKAQIAEHWGVTDLGEPSKIIGIEILRASDSISITQRQYIETILRKEGMERANPVAVPMDPNNLPVPNPDPGEDNRSNPYAQLLGELQYLATSTRPDISFAVHRLASYTANPSMQHYSMLKRVLRYLAGTRNYGITYRKNLQPITPFHGFSDAGFANTDERKSTTGLVFLSAGGAISWRSKKQSLSAQSTTEAEYIALATAGNESRWLRNLYSELGLPCDFPTPIRCDNLSAISISSNPYTTQHSHHINLKWHTIWQLVAWETIIPTACRDAEQTADILTKPLPRPKHKQHTAEMGLAPV